MKTFRTFGKKRDSPSQSNNNSQDQYYDQQPQDQYYDQQPQDQYYDQHQQDQYYHDQPNTQPYYDQTNDQNYRQVEYFDNNPNNNLINNEEYESNQDANLNNNIIESDEQIDYNTLKSREQQEDTSEKRVKINDVNEYDTDEDVVKKEPPVVEKRPKYDFHFATKIRNSGYWGKVYLRKGTWMVIIGFVLFIISIVLIGVFWGFWYSNALNFPMRILAITFLSSGLSMMAFGLISNYLMFLDSDNKIILGSPLRKSAYVLAICLFLLVIASDCITLYYTYWKNRWINTPLIIIAIVLYFFAGLGFLGALWTIFEFNLVRYGLMDSAEERLEKKQKRQDFEERLKRLSSETLYGNKNSKKSWDLLLAEQQGIIQLNETEMDQSNERNGFRRNHPIQLIPKPVILTSAVTSPNTTTQLDDSNII